MTAVALIFVVIFIAAWAAVVAISFIFYIVKFMILFVKGFRAEWRRQSDH